MKTYAVHFSLKNFNNYEPHRVTFPADSIQEAQEKAEAALVELLKENNISEERNKAAIEEYSNDKDKAISDAAIEFNENNYKIESGLLRMRIRFSDENDVDHDIGFEVRTLAEVLAADGFFRAIQDYCRDMGIAFPISKNAYHRMKF